MATQSKDDIDEIKQRVRVWDVARRWYQADIPDRIGVYATPWREDNSPSFSIFADGTMWKDQATGEYGDVITMLTRDGKTFTQSLAILGDWCDLKNIRFERREKKHRELAKLPPTPAEWKKIAAKSRNEVKSWRETNNVLKQLCVRKRWDPKLMDALIQRGCVGLNKERLTWIFERGVKVRSSPFASRGDRWLCGKSSCCLFLDFIFNPRAPLVLLCEGETDCVSALFSGICKQGCASVLGVSGASVKPHADLLKPMIYGKTVVIIGDNDKAGRSFIKRMSQHISLMGVIPRHFNWGDRPYNDIGDFFASEGPGPVRDSLANSNNWSLWENPKDKNSTAES